MQITEVRIKLMEEGDDRLQAFCSITFDNAFVIRDLKIIEGSSGPFVAMPSRKLTAKCPGCSCKNHLRASYCNQCGRRLPPAKVARDPDGRQRMYADIAHPINVECREMIQSAVIVEFQSEKERAKLPGYVSRYDDHDYDYEFGEGEPRPDAGHPSFPKGASLQREAEPLRPPHVRPESEPADPNRPASSGEQRDES